MRARATSPIPFPVRRPKPDDAIEWAAYPRIEPGKYFAYCFWADKYMDRGFQRWTCLLRWDVLSEDQQKTIAKPIPLWFTLGSGDKARAPRRGRYLREWVRANGSPPVKGDRLSPNVFTRRIARVEIGDTDSPVPYSVVRKIIEWQTGNTGHSVIQYTSQVRQ